MTRISCTWRQSRRPLSSAGGFTLIELMVVVAIVAILAAIAYPSYQNHVTKTRRGAAVSCLQEVAHFMERYYTTNLSYSGTNVPTLECRSQSDNFYTIDFSGNPDTTSYLITAVPKGAQESRDTKCGTLGLNHRGQRSVSGTGSVSECW